MKAKFACNETFESILAEILKTSEFGDGDDLWRFEKSDEDTTDEKEAFYMRNTWRGPNFDDDVFVLVETDSIKINSVPCLVLAINEKKIRSMAFYATFSCCSYLITLKDGVFYAEYDGGYKEFLSPYHDTMPKISPCNADST